MDFKFNDLKAMLPEVQKTQGDDFVKQIERIVVDSANLKELETGIIGLFNKNGVNYAQTFANSSKLKAGETDSEDVRKIDNKAIQNELITVVVQTIDKKAKELGQTSENSASGKE